MRRGSNDVLTRMKGVETEGRVRGEVGSAIIKGRQGGQV